MRIQTFSQWAVVFIVIVAAGPARADTILWYNGNLAANGGGTVNEQTTNGGSFNIYDDFNVTGAGWIVDRVWSNNSMQFTGVTQAAWSIRSGMSVGNGGTVIASGTSSATQTPTGLSNPSLGFLDYTIQVTGLNVTLAPGVYWLSVSPLVGADPTVTFGGVFRSYNSRTAGANAVGTPPGNDMNSFFNSSFLGYNYAPAFGNDYSMGVAGTQVGAVPEPASITAFGIGAACLAAYVLRRRKRLA